MGDPGRRLVAEAERKRPVVCLARQERSLRERRAGNVHLVGDEVVGGGELGDRAEPRDDLYVLVLQRRGNLPPERLEAVRRDDGLGHGPVGRHGGEPHPLERQAGVGVVLELDELLLVAAGERELDDLRAGDQPLDPLGRALRQAVDRLGRDEGLLRVERADLELERRGGRRLGVAAVVEARLDREEARARERVGERGVRRRALELAVVPVDVPRAGHGLRDAAHRLDGVRERRGGGANSVVDELRGPGRGGERGLCVALRRERREGERELLGERVVRRHEGVDRDVLVLGVEVLPDDGVDDVVSLGARHVVLRLHGGVDHLAVLAGERELHADDAVGAAGARQPEDERRADLAGDHRRLEVGDGRDLGLARAVAGDGDRARLHRGRLGDRHSGGVARGDESNRVVAGGEVGPLGLPQPDGEHLVRLPGRHEVGDEPYLDRLVGHVAGRPLDDAASGVVLAARLRRAGHGRVVDRDGALLRRALQRERGVLAGLRGVEVRRCEADGADVHRLVGERVGGVLVLAALGVFDLDVDHARWEQRLVDGLHLRELRQHAVARVDERHHRARRAAVDVVGQRERVCAACHGRELEEVRGVLHVERAADGLRRVGRRRQRERALHRVVARLWRVVVHCRRDGRLLAVHRLRRGLLRRGHHVLLVVDVVEARGQRGHGLVGDDPRRGVRVPGLDRGDLGGEGGLESGRRGVLDRVAVGGELKGGAGRVRRRLGAQRICACHAGRLHDEFAERDVDHVGDLLARNRVGDHVGRGVERLDLRDARADPVVRVVQAGRLDDVRAVGERGEHPDVVHRVLRRVERHAVVERIALDVRLRAGRVRDPRGDALGVERAYLVAEDDVCRLVAGVLRLELVGLPGAACDLVPVAPIAAVERVDLALGAADEEVLAVGERRGDELGSAREHVVHGVGRVGRAELVVREVRGEGQGRRLGGRPVAHVERRVVHADVVLARHVGLDRHAHVVAAVADGGVPADDLAGRVVHDHLVRRVVRVVGVEDHAVALGERDHAEVLVDDAVVVVLVGGDPAGDELVRPAVLRAEGDGLVRADRKRRDPLEREGELPVEVGARLGGVGDLEEERALRVRDNDRRDVLRLGVVGVIHIERV